MDKRDKIIELLNEYYGSSRSDEHKEEIADFIVSNYYQIEMLMEDG